MELVEKLRSCFLFLWDARSRFWGGASSETQGQSVGTIQRSWWKFTRTLYRPD